MTLEDTPIFDEKYFSEIKKLHPQANELGKKDLRRRVAVAEKFIEYLENKEKFEAIENQAYIKDIVTSIKTRCQDDIDRIRRVISNASYN